jgi:hypothetical protein
VQAYDHTTGAFTAPLRVLSGRSDTHNYPTMVQAPDGHLLIFVGMHNVELVMARSARPHAVDGAWTVRTIPEGRAASYPMPFRAANGHLFVFFRETTHTIRSSVPVDTRPLLYVRSTDNGATWRSSAQLTGDAYALGSTNRSDNLNEIYVGQLRHEPAGASGERVHLSWAVAGGGPGHHAHATYLKDMHYVTFDPTTLRFQDVRGKDLGPQVGNAEQEQNCKVATTALGKPQVYHISQTASLANGRPFVIWATHDTKLLFRNKISVWSGSAWETTDVGTGLSVRDIEPLSKTTWRAYVTHEGIPNIDTYVFEPGRSWTPEATIPTPKEVQRMELITGFQDPARLLASGDSSSRGVSVADGDIYVVGLAGKR